MTNRPFSLCYDIYLHLIINAKYVYTFCLCWKQISCSTSVIFIVMKKGIWLWYITCVTYRHFLVKTKITFTFSCVGLWLKFSIRSKYSIKISSIDNSTSCNDLFTFITYVNSKKFVNRHVLLIYKQD